MLKNTYTGCLGLSPAILSQFSVEMCAAFKNSKKNKKDCFGEWERDLRSFKVINVDKSQKPVTSACYDMQQVRTYLQPFPHYTSQ